MDLGWINETKAARYLGVSDRDWKGPAPPNSKSEIGFSDRFQTERGFVVELLFSFKNQAKSVPVAMLTKPVTWRPRKVLLLCKKTNVWQSGCDNSCPPGVEIKENINLLMQMSPFEFYLERTFRGESILYTTFAWRGLRANSSKKQSWETTFVTPKTHNLQKSMDFTCKKPGKLIRWISGRLSETGSPPKSKYGQNRVSVTVWNT